MPKATIQASVVSSTVTPTPDGPLLKITLTARLDDVPQNERGPLVEVLNNDQSMTVTFGGDVPIPRSTKKANSGGSGDFDAA